jgi:hypothetical protein
VVGLPVLRISATRHITNRKQEQIEKVGVTIRLPLSLQHTGYPYPGCLPLSLSMCWKFQASEHSSDSSLFKLVVILLPAVYLHSFQTTTSAILKYLGEKNQFRITLTEVLRPIKSGREIKASSINSIQIQCLRSLEKAW